MSKKREEKWKGDRFSSRSPQGAGVHQSDNWLPQLAQVAKPHILHQLDIVPENPLPAGLLVTCTT